MKQNTRICIQNIKLLVLSYLSAIMICSVGWAAPPPHHEDIKRLGEAAGNAIRAALNEAAVPYREFSLVLVRDGIAINSKSEAVACFWLFYHYEIGIGDAKAEGVAVISAIPYVSKGEYNMHLTFDIASIRVAEGLGSQAFSVVADLLAGTDATKLFVKAVGGAEGLVNDKIDKYANLASTKLAIELGFKVPLKGIFYMPPLLDAATASQRLFPLKSGVIVDHKAGTDYAGKEVKIVKPEEAVLIVVAITETDINAIAWRRAKDISGGVIEREIRYPGQSVRIFYLGDNSQVKDLATYRRKQGGTKSTWGDAIGFILIIPGPKYKNEKLYSYGHSMKDSRWPGGTVRLKPGVHAVVLRKPIAKSGTTRGHLDGAISSMGVK